MILFYRNAVLFTTLAVVSAGVAPTHGQRSSFEDLRNKMVDKAVVGGGVTDSRVIDAIRQTPRHEFVSKTQKRRAYYDMALPIGSGQTISPPYIVAFMTERLEPKSTDRVLEVGTGSGYQAAVLSPLVDQVYSIEIVEALGKKAKRTLRRLKLTNVHTKVGDGYKGWSEHAPFDKIIVTCSPESIPQPLIDQLVDGGRMVIPLGERFQQTLYLFKKVDGKLEQESLEPTFFVPMTGQAEAEREKQIDEAVPKLRHTSFESAADESGMPEGWFYGRQVTITEEHGASDGNYAVSFNNTDPGRPSHIMQAFGIDGTKYSSLRLRLDAKGVNIGPGRYKTENAGVMVEFYGPNRRPAGSKRVSPWTGTFDWEERNVTVAVPRSARLAIIGVGLFGGTGNLIVDDVQVDEGNKRDEINVLDN